VNQHQMHGVRPVIHQGIEQVVHRSPRDGMVVVQYENKVAGELLNLIAERGVDHVLGGGWRAWSNVRVLGRRQ